MPISTMALSNTTASQIVDAAESDISSYHNNNSLEHKTVRAEIRVREIVSDAHDEPRQDETSVPLIEQPNPSAQDVQDQERAEEMRSWWNNEMKKHMNQPDGYSKVAVLLIKWADELDELKTKRETEELDALFRERFHYQTTIAELTVRRKPQHQLNSHISDFIRDYDGPNNLLIIYYTGHGVFKEDKKYLELTASENPTVQKGFSSDAVANWNKVEEKLRDEEVEGDILTILDTCYASNLVKKSGRSDTKKFELIAASPIDRTTASPGEFSFTRALIDGLKELLDNHKEPISTWRIVQHTNLNKNRSDTPAQLWIREQRNEHHIFLAPLKPQKPDTKQPLSFRHSPGGYLTLRFGIRPSSLNKEQIEYMTKTLSHALFNKPLVGLTKIEWMELRPAPPIPRLDRVALVMFAVTQWKKVVSHRKQERESQMGQKLDLHHASSQKREHEGVDNLPDAKRQYLDPAQPPSPPVSDSYVD